MMLMVSMACCWVIHPEICASDAKIRGSGTRSALPIMRVRSHCRLQIHPRSRWKTRAEPAAAVAMPVMISNPERERFAEVDALHLRIAPQRLRAAGAEDPAVINDVGAIGDLQSLAHVVIRHQ